MDFDLGPEEEEFRREVRAFMEKHVTTEMLRKTHETGTVHDWGLHRAMAERGWLALSWPEEYGGQGRDPMESTIFVEEANLAKAPLYGVNTTVAAARAILKCGSAEIKERVLPPFLAGEILICLGFSEPDSGSDVGSVKTRAVRDGESWVINGQKVFTSTAEESEYVFLLCRTDPDVPKHQGLTMFLVPMDTPGIQIDPIHTLAERTNTTFYTDVIVDDCWRVGDVNRGWDVVTASLTFERGGNGFQGHMIRLLTDAVNALALRDNLPSRASLEIGRFAAEIQIARMLDQMTAWTSAQGSKSAVTGSMSKLFGSEHYTDFCATVLDLLGPESLLQTGDDDAPADGTLEYAHRFATPTTVYGGASEVQRSIIAERGLGLPRSR